MKETCGDDVGGLDEAGTLVLGASDHLQADVSPADHALVVVVVEGCCIFQVLDDDCHVAVALGRRGVHQPDVLAVGKEEPGVRRRALHCQAEEQQGYRGQPHPEHSRHWLHSLTQPNQT